MSRSILFDLASERSPAEDVMHRLVAFLSSTDPWHPVESLFGPISQWDADRRNLSRELTEQLMGEVQRRADEPFQTPYLKYLPAIADPNNDVAARSDAARALFALDERVLDKACLLLRRRAGVPETLLEPFWQSFIFHALNKVPLRLPWWS